MTSSSSNPYGGQGPTLAVLGWTSFSSGLAVVLLRLITLWIVGLQPQWDLYFCLLATACGVAAQPFLVLSASHGIGNHIDQVPPYDLERALLYQWCYHSCGIMSTVFSKLAIGNLLQKIQGPTMPRMRRFLQFVVYSSFLLGFNQSILIWFQCWPVNALWKTNAVLNPKCPRVSLILHIGTLQGSWSAAGDFVLAFYPSIVFWTVKIKITKKLALCALFCGGSFAGVAAILKTFYILRLTASSDITTAISPLLIWEQIELWLIIIMASLPRIRPLFVYFVKGQHASHTGWTEQGFSASKSIRLQNVSSRMAGNHVADKHVTHWLHKRDTSRERILLNDTPTLDAGILVTRDYAVQPVLELQIEDTSNSQKSKLSAEEASP